MKHNRHEVIQNLQDKLSSLYHRGHSTYHEIARWVSDHHWNSYQEEDIFDQIIHILTKHTEIGSDISNLADDIIEFAFPDLDLHLNFAGAPGFGAEAEFAPAPTPAVASEEAPTAPVAVSEEVPVVSGVEETPAVASEEAPAAPVAVSEEAPVVS